MKAAIIVMVVLSLGLAGGLFMRHNTAVQVEKKQVDTILDFSNKLTQTSANLDEQVQVNSTLQNTLEARKRDLLDTSNNLVKVTADLARTRSEAQAAAENAKAELAQRDQRINELETQRSDLTKKMDDLTLNIDKLGIQITETEKKLEASEGDREFLLTELKRLQAEKVELERQFNDLSVLRSQVAKLKDELSIARRLEWIRMGIYGAQERKGAEILMTGVNNAPARPKFDLNVELKQDGAATIVPVQTNAGPATAQPPK
jgi:chromosome segregation ATPase